MSASGTSFGRALIPHAEAIVRDPDAIFSHGERKTTHLVKWQREKCMPVSDIDFWIFAGLKNGQRITVVVRQVKGKRKHFFSVYGKKQKTARP